MKLKTLLESDPQTYRKLMFIRSSTSNIRKTLRSIDWNKATENEKDDIYRSIQHLLQIIK